VTSLSPVGIFTVFSAVVLGVAGVSLFSLGATFNYLVSLFYRQPIRQGLFGKPIFRTPLDRHFWWLGVLGISTGAVLALGSLVLGTRGWPMDRLWFWMLFAAMSTIIGLQLLISWFIMRILEQLSQRDKLVEKDMRGNGYKAQIASNLVSIEHH
jgi:hypothetical protein